MNEKIKKRKNEIEMFLNESVEHQDKKIDYILYDPDTYDTYILASNDSEDAIEFTPYNESNDGYSTVPEWDYNFDYYIYNYLGEGKKIAYMSDNVHYGIWNSIHELYLNDIEFKDGVQVYLQYCTDNGITKEYIDKKTGFATPDIMKYKDYIYEHDNLFIGKTLEQNKTRKLGNGMYVLDVGYRNNQPVALVEKNTDYGIEYVIAFNYVIDNDRINCAYGRYYGNDINKATQDFKNVLSGKNLADSFSNNKEDNAR